MAEFVTKGCVQSGEYVRLNADEEIFGNKDFINDITIRGDLTVSGDTRITKIVDFTSESGDISGYAFRGEVGYFDRIVVGDIEGADSGSSSGESSGGIDTGPIFVTSASAVGGVTEIIESDFGGAIIRKVKTASDEVDVQLLIERGDAQKYKPDVSFSISGVSNSSQSIDHSQLTQNFNGYSFNTTIRVDSSSPQTYLFKNGSRQTYIEIEKDTPPEVIEAKFVNLQGTSSFYKTSSFNGASGSQVYQQTEAKNGDTARVSVTATKDIGQIYITGQGVSSKTINNPTTANNGDGTFSAVFDVSISGGSNSPQARGFNIRVNDKIGNPSVTYVSDNQIVTNNLRPTASANFNYPANQVLIDNQGESVNVSVAASNFDDYNFSKSSVLNFEQTPSDINTQPFVVSGINASNYTSGTVSFSFFKASNGTSTNVSTSPIQIQSVGTTPSVNFSPNLFRSSSGAPQFSTVNVSVGEPVESMSIESVSDEDIDIGELTKNSSTSFSFQISISDNTPRGEFTINFLGRKLSGDDFQKSDTGTVRGFSQRTVLVSAPAYLPVDLGVDVFNVSKLSATAAPVGGNTFNIPYDAGITGAKQDGTSNLEAGFGIINGSELVVDNQVITNAGNILDVNVVIEESL